VASTWHDRAVTDQPESETLVAMHDALLLDLDGVVYIGAEPVPHATEALNDAAQSGVRVVYVTNNASRPPSAVCEQLVGMGLDVRERDIMTSAQAGAQLASEQFEPGSRVLAVGGPGVAAALTEAGLNAVDAMEGLGSPAGDDVEAVLQGFGRELSWYALARASQAVSGGATWIATNTDMTIPTEYGIVPGNGTLVQAVAVATKATPAVVGKPFARIFKAAAEKSDARMPLVVGDRLDTDILGASNSEMASLLVLTGVSGALDLWLADPGYRPTFIGSDLRALLEPPLLVISDRGAVTCRGARATIVDGMLSVGCPGPAVEGIWAAAHLIWAEGFVPGNAHEIASFLADL
jgi:glycerol 3-phosphatase-2